MRSRLIPVLGLLIVLLAGAIVFALSQREEVVTTEATLVYAQQQLNQQGTQIADLSATSAANLQNLHLIKAEVQVREAQRFAENNPQAAIELALASLEHYEEGVYLPESRTVLLDALSRYGERPLLMKHENRVFGAAYNRDDSLILTWSGDGAARIWKTDGSLTHTFQHSAAVNGARWSSDDARVLTWSQDGTVRVWDAQSGDELLRLIHPAPVSGARWSPDETRFLTWSADRSYVWDAEGDLEFTLVHADRVNGGRWREDG